MEDELCSSIERRIEMNDTLKQLEHDLANWNTFSERQIMMALVEVLKRLEKIEKELKKMNEKDPL